MSKELGLGGDSLSAAIGRENNSSADPGKYRLVREGEVVCPSDMVAFGDAYTCDFNPPGWPDRFFARTDLSPMDGVVGNELGLSEFSAQLLGQGWWNEPKWNRRRHGGKWLMAFVDAHVEQRGVVEWFNPKVDGIVRRWNRDHQPHPENVGQSRQGPRHIMHQLTTFLCTTTLPGMARNVRVESPGAMSLTMAEISGRELAAAVIRE